MSSMIEPSALWQALQDVDDGQDPAEVYARVLNESADPSEAIEDDYRDSIEFDHPHRTCREKWQQVGYCLGNECVSDGLSIRLMLRCPCECHAGEDQ